MIGKLLGDGLDRGDPADEVRAPDRDWVTRGAFPGTYSGELPVYHEYARCRETRRKRRMRNVERATAQEYAVPCPECVIPAGVAADDDLATPRDVLDAMDDPPDLRAQNGGDYGLSGRSGACVRTGETSPRPHETDLC